MSKGVYKDQLGSNDLGPRFHLSSNLNYEPSHEMGKCVFKGQPGDLSPSSRVPSEGKGVMRTVPMTAQPIWHDDLSFEDEEKFTGSQGSTQHSTRASSPHPPAQTKLGQEIPVQPGTAIKIVLDSVTPATSTPEAEKLHPQQSMTKFWTNFEPEYLGKVTRILPTSLVDSTAKTPPEASGSAYQTVQSYSQAREKCIRDVKRIVRECRALNVKYTDVHFDIERDLKITRLRDCLDGLVMEKKDRAYPSDVKRVCDIFETPKFFANPAGYDDMIQGSLGDCWLLAAFSILTCREQLVRKVCVTHDADVGVYGFVFYRDGEWHQCIIDDKLYLRAPSYDESGDVVLGMYGVQQRDQERSYTDLFQKGSRSLFFGQCRDENETWVPLLEKALAKAHGSYNTLVGGQTGEAIEDLTGGVTTEIYTTNILNKDAFWYDELRKIGKEFLFSGAAASYREWRPSSNKSVRDERRQGIVSSHAYAILDTYEGFGQKLVKMRNPWGSTEWSGAWSDGSKEWNSDWFERLNHKFGDDGIFWISYEDMLKKYKYLDRTRIFGDEWHVVQQWTSVQVPWNTADYQQTRFSIEVPEDTDTVIVLSQLDDRYFQGLQGKYNYTLQFRVQKDDENEEEYIARTPHNYELVRSANVEVRLEKGRYDVLFKIEAHKTNRLDVEQVIRNNIWRKEKLKQIGTLYDLAHQKGQANATLEASQENTTEKAKSTDSQTTNIEKKEKDKEKEDANKDPWNAFCLVGLRVYSKQADLELKVKIPSKDEEAQPPALDRDDIAKAALEEAQASTGTSNPEESAANETSEDPAKPDSAISETQGDIAEGSQDTVTEDKPSEEPAKPNDESQETKKPEDQTASSEDQTMTDTASSTDDSMSVSVISETEIDLAGDKKRLRRY